MIKRTWQDNRKRLGHETAADMSRGDQIERAPMVSQLIIRSGVRAGAIEIPLVKQVKALLPKSA